jgi:hypothetical protein
VAISITKPTVGGDNNVWGAKLNTALDDIVTEVNRVGGLVGSGGGGSTGIPASTVTAKGDLLVASASGTVTRVGVGSSGQVLTADSTTGTGVAWKTPTTTAASVPPGTLVMKATKTTSQTISSGTGQYVTFNQIDYNNTAAGFNSASTGFSSYGPGVAGWYEITGGVAFNGTTDQTNRGCWLYVGTEVPGSSVITLAAYGVTSAVSVRPSVVQLSAGSTIGLYAYHTFGSNLNTYYGGQHACTLTVKWLGA